MILFSQNSFYVLQLLFLVRNVFRPTTSITGFSLLRHFFDHFRSSLIFFNLCCRFQFFSDPQFISPKPISSSFSSLVRDLIPFYFTFSYLIWITLYQIVPLDFIFQKSIYLSVFCIFFRDVDRFLFLFLF